MTNNNKPFSNYTSTENQNLTQDMPSQTNNREGIRVALYLIPVTLGDTAIERALPAYNQLIVKNIKHFIVEDIRSARRFLKQVDKSIDIDSLTFKTLNKRTSPEDILQYLKPLEAGKPMAIISEAGCPAIADPGADVVSIAQRKNLSVIPLVGPSSIILSVMASGFNGQSFAFHGYLPIQTPDRIRRIKQLESRIYNEEQTQLFIETPYRNDKLLANILATCKSKTKLCIAINITCEDEEIITKEISSWKKETPTIGKRPCIFLLYK